MSKQPLVKICGLRSVEAAQTAIDSGADMLGMILVPGRERTVDLDVGKEITNLVQKTRKERGRKILNAKILIEKLNEESETLDESEFQAKANDLILENGPFIVGVFRNQSEDFVYETAKNLNLDFIQLHGSEDKIQFLKRNALENHQFGVIPRFVVPRDTTLMRQIFKPEIRGDGIVIGLLDSEAGGEGKTIDWDVVSALENGKYLLAGGLSPENVREGLAVDNVIGVDVSGGVETNGVKDLNKIKAFVKNAKNQI